MKIIVCVKQVPNTIKVPIDTRTGTLMREGCPSDINQDDKHALEEALRLRAQHGGSVTVVSMGPTQAEESLRESLAIGADEAILLTDRAFGGADTSCTSYVLASAVSKIGDFDLILCGRQSSDGSTGHVGPQLAEELSLPQITSVRKLQIEGKTIRAERSLADGCELEVVEAQLPVLATVTTGMNTPRKPAIVDILDACRRRQITAWNAADLNLDQSKIGLGGSLTKMIRAFRPQPRERSGKIYSGSMPEVVQNLLDALETKHLISGVEL